MVIGAITVLAALAFSQQPPTGPSPVELAAMKKLSFLVGKWEGDSWTQRGSNKEFARGTENVQWKLQGKALLVEGVFSHVDTKAIVHETLAIITYDEKTSKYKFSTFLVNQPNAEYELTVKENGFSWSMKPSDSVAVNFTMDLVDGDWVEIGEFSFNGGAKTKFLEMKLKKVKK